MSRSRVVAYLAAPIAAIGLVLWLVGVFEWPQVQHIADCSRSQRIVFQTSGMYPSGVTVRVRGHIDGTATLTTVEDRWPPQQISGDVDWSVYHDWFYSTCTFEYSPANVASGRLKVELKFH